MFGSHFMSLSTLGPLTKYSTVVLEIRKQILLPPYKFVFPLLLFKILFLKLSQKEVVNLFLQHLNV